MADDNKEFDGIRYRIETKSPTVFRVLLSVLVIWGVCFMAYYLFGGWSSEGEFARKKLARQGQLANQSNEGGAPATAPLKEGKRGDYRALGKKEFAERCASCHGTDARGGIGPDLTRKEFKFGKTDTSVTESITEGRPGGMPAFKNDLSREKIEGLTQYILSL